MKIYLILLIIILISGCSTTSGEWIKAKNQYTNAESDAIRAANKYNLEASRYRQITKLLKMEFHRLMQLDAAYRKAIRNTNCPVEM